MTNAQPQTANPALAPAKTNEMTLSQRASARFFMFSLTLLGVLVTWSADPFVGVGMFSAGLLGWRGFNNRLIKGVLAVIGILAICAWSVPLGKMLTPGLRGLLNWPFVPTRQFAVLLMALGILGASYLLGAVFAWWYRRHYGSFQRYGRLLGMGVGMVQGVLFTATVSVALLAIEPAARMSLSMIMDDSALASGAYNQLVRLRRFADATAVGKRLSDVTAAQREVLEMGGSLAIISRYPGALDNLKRNPIVVELMEHNPAIDRIEREIRLDRDLKAAVKAGDLRKILNSSTVVRLLDDEELAEAVEAHRDELFEAIIVSVPNDARDLAFKELAKLRGMGVKEFKSFAATRIAAYEVKPDRTDPPSSDATLEHLESAAEP